jgi:putative endonuclease
MILTMKHHYFVYIMTNLHNTVLYTGVTGNLYQRVLQHKKGEGGKFTSKYHANKLVYFETYQDVYEALNREKAIKGGSRKKKIDLINDNNPAWVDLFYDLQF